jgi:hypothetical protein
MLLCRHWSLRNLDLTWDLFLSLLYLLYLTLVQGALSVFDCSKNQDGDRILDADPSIKCGVVCSFSLPPPFSLRLSPALVVAVCEP